MSFSEGTFKKIVAKVDGVDPVEREITEWQGNYQDKDLRFYTQNAASLPDSKYYPYAEISTLRAYSLRDAQSWMHLGEYSLITVKDDVVVLEESIEANRVLLRSHSQAQPKVYLGGAHQAEVDEGNTVDETGNNAGYRMLSGLLHHRIQTVVSVGDPTEIGKPKFPNIFGFAGQRYSQDEKIWQSKDGLTCIKCTVDQVNQTNKADHVAQVVVKLERGTREDDQNEFAYDGIDHSVTFTHIANVRDHEPIPSVRNPQLLVPVFDGLAGGVDHSVLFHCSAGLQRSPQVLAAGLLYQKMKDGKAITLDIILDVVKTIRGQYGSGRTIAFLYKDNNQFKAFMVAAYQLAKQVFEASQGAGTRAVVPEKVTPKRITVKSAVPDITTDDDFVELKEVAETDFGGAYPVTRRSDQEEMVAEAASKRSSETAASSTSSRKPLQPVSSGGYKAEIGVIFGGYNKQTGNKSDAKVDFDNGFAKSLKLCMKEVASSLNESTKSITFSHIVGAVITQVERQPDPVKNQMRAYLGYGNPSGNIVFEHAEIVTKVYDLLTAYAIYKNQKEAKKEVAELPGVDHILVKAVRELKPGTAEKSVRLRDAIRALYPEPGNWFVTDDEFTLQLKPEKSGKKTSYRVDVEIGIVEGSATSIVGSPMPSFDPLLGSPSAATPSKVGGADSEDEGEEVRPEDQPSVATSAASISRPLRSTAEAAHETSTPVLRMPPPPPTSVPPFSRGNGSSDSSGSLEDLLKSKTNYMTQPPVSREVYEEPEVETKPAAPAAPSMPSGGAPVPPPPPPPPTPTQLANAAKKTSLPTNSSADSAASADSTPPKKPGGNPSSSNGAVEMAAELAARLGKKNGTPSKSAEEMDKERAERKKVAQETSSPAWALNSGKSGSNESLPVKPASTPPAPPAATAPKIVPVPVKPGTAATLEASAATASKPAVTTPPVAPTVPAKPVTPPAEAAKPAALAPTPTVATEAKPATAPPVAPTVPAKPATPPAATNPVVTNGSSFAASAEVKPVPSAATAPAKPTTPPAVAAKPADSAFAKPVAAPSATPAVPEKSTTPPTVPAKPATPPAATNPAVTNGSSFAASAEVKPVPSAATAPAKPTTPPAVAAKPADSAFAKPVAAPSATPAVPEKPTTPSAEVKPAPSAPVFAAPASKPEASAATAPQKARITVADDIQASESDPRKQTSGVPLTKPISAPPAPPTAPVPQSFAAPVATESSAPVFAAPVSKPVTTPPAPPTVPTAPQKTRITAEPDDDIQASKSDSHKPVPQSFVAPVATVSSVPVSKPVAPTKTVQAYAAPAAVSSREATSSNFGMQDTRHQSEQSSRRRPVESPYAAELSSSQYGRQEDVRYNFASSRSRRTEQYSPQYGDHDATAVLNTSSAPYSRAGFGMESASQPYGYPSQQSDRLGYDQRQDVSVRSRRRAEESPQDRYDRKYGAVVTAACAFLNDRDDFDTGEYIDNLEDSLSPIGGKNLSEKIDHVINKTYEVPSAQNNQIALLALGFAQVAAKEYSADSIGRRLPRFQVVMAVIRSLCEHKIDLLMQVEAHNVAPNLYKRAMELLNDQFTVEGATGVLVDALSSIRIPRSGTVSIKQPLIDAVQDALARDTDA